MGFRIIICGAGLGGLGAAIALVQQGHSVVVLEAAQQLAEVGAGIQIPPNSSRILKSYGIYEDILKLVVWPQSIIIRRYSNGKVIGNTPLDPAMSEAYGIPYFLIHRADYQRCLYHHAVKLGVQVLLGSPVEAIDEFGPSVTLGDGSTIKGDLIVGADGIRSKVRKAILGADDLAPRDSPDCAYRATVSCELMMADPQTAHLMSSINANCWIGDSRHIMAYPIRNGEMYNLVMLHPGQASVGRWNEPGNLEEMNGHYRDFDPTIRRVLSKVEYCVKWKLADLPPLPSWIGSSGRAVLIGDAAHAMVPYLAQGASMAIEDGAALADCLAYASSVDDLPQVLSLFQTIRKERCEIIQAGSRKTGDTWHLPDGPGQEQRDEMMMAEMRLRAQGSHKRAAQNPNRWSDKDFQPWLFGHDVGQEVSKVLQLQQRSKLQAS